MTYRLGNFKRIKELGKTVSLTCPNCNKEVEFSVFTNGKLELIPKFPLVKGESVYFLVCPNCSAVYGVRESAGKTFREGEKLAIGNYDLKELEPFKE